MPGIFETITNLVTGKVTRFALQDSAGEPVIFDVTKSFSRAFINDVTEHSIENGANISDNAKTNPYDISLSVLLSDSDYLGIAGVKVLRDKTIEERFAFLRFWLNNKTFPLKLITDEEEIPNLIIKSVSESRSTGEGNGKSLDLTLKQITVVSSQQAAAGINVQGYKPKATTTKEPSPGAQATMAGFEIK